MVNHTIIHKAISERRIKLILPTRRLFIFEFWSILQVSKSHWKPLDQVLQAYQNMLNWFTLLERNTYIYNASIQKLSLSSLIFLLEVFSKKRCSEKFHKFHRKTPVLESLQACNFIKKRLYHRCFPVKFVKFWRTYAII